MPAFDSYQDILHDLNDRHEWEQRQAIWYAMRHHGLRRPRLPFPGASDMHFPLVAGQIDRLKAFYYQQLFATPTLASFTSLKQQDDELTGAVGDWMDYRLKQRTNIERAHLTLIDLFLMTGFCPLKIYWDENKKSIVYRPVNPLYFIVPKYVADIQDKSCNRIVHVFHTNEEAYRANKGYTNQDDTFIKAITGNKPTYSCGGTTSYEQTKEAREGITVGRSEHEIVLWEIQTRESDGIKVETYSPMQPDEPVRKPFMLPYHTGVFKDGDKFNFAIYQMEVKDEGIYSPRGVPEIQANFEQSLNKMWNAKHDWMDYFGNPQYQNEGTDDLGNISNIRSLPGGVLPKGLTPVVNPPPPVSFDEEMQGTRALAETVLSIPDLGATAHYGVDPGSSEHPTATQVNAIVQQSSVPADMRVRIFRIGFQDTLRMSWSILLERDKDSLDYVVQNSVSQISKEALHDAYLIEPSGSADSWNRNVQLQKSVNRLTLWRNDPFIDQGELRKTCLELDDAGLVKRLYRPPQIQQQDQAEQQSLETLLMLNGFGASVHDTDNNQVHLQNILGFGQVRLQEQNPITPVTAALLKQHILDHLGKMQQTGDKSFGQFQQLMRPMIAMLTQIASSGAPPAMGGQPPQPPTTGMSPPQGAPQPPPGQNGARESISINYKDAPPDIQRQMEAKAGMQPSQMPPVLPQPKPSRLAGQPPLR